MLHKKTGLEFAIARVSVCQVLIGGTLGYWGILTLQGTEWKKKHSCTYRRGMIDFSIIIKGLIWLSPPLFGESYTWTRNFSGAVVSKIDRFLHYRMEWSLQHHKTISSSLCFLGSSPTFAWMCQWSRNSSYFKLENMWLESNGWWGFGERVVGFFQHSWQAEFHLSQEIWDAEIQAQGVVSDPFGNLESRKSFILNKILKLDQEAEGSFQLLWMRLWLKGRTYKRNWWKPSNQNRSHGYGRNKVITTLVFSHKW